MLFLTIQSPMQIPVLLLFKVQNEILGQSCQKTKIL